MQSLETEDQEWERVKAWWKQNGTSVIAGVVIGTAVVFGTQWWRNYRTHQAEQASALYEQMMIEYAGRHADRARALAERILKDYRRGPYAGFAALYLARIAHEGGDGQGAAKQLRRALEVADDPALRHAARLRLAWLQAAAGDREGAASSLGEKNREGFAGFYADQEGDLAADAGRPGAARRHYQAALAALAADMTATATIVRHKLDDLGEETTP